MMPVVMKPEPQDQTVPPHPVQPPAVMPTSSAAVPITAPTPVTSAVTTEQLIVENEEKLPEDMENRIDVESIKGVFGWATVDGVNVPYIIRKYKKFVSVRIVEKKLLSRYPNAFPDELAKKDPLVSFFVTEYEAKLLDEINTIHCSYEYGTQSFTTKELIVDLVEFEDFYNLVKKTFPDEVLAKLRSNEQPPESTTPDSVNRENLEKMCAWIQINNTVTPVIRRNEFTFVPLSVIKYAAGLLKNVSLEGIQPSTDDCALLNETCKIAGFDFQFGPKTKLIELAEIVRHCQPTILQLPFDDPLKHARYLDTPSPSGQPPTSPTTTPHSSPPTSMPNTQTPPQSHQYPYQRPNVPVNPFAMMQQMMSRSMVPQQLAYSQPGLMPNAMANPAMVQRMYNQQPRQSTGLAGGKPSHPSQMQQQMNPGKTPPYPHGYNPNLPPNHPANLGQARVNFPQDQMQGQKGATQHPSRHNMPPDVFPPNQSYPGHNPRSLPPTPPYQSPMASGRGGITSNAGNMGLHSSSTSSSGASSGNFPSRQSKPGATPNNQNSASPKTGNNHLKIEGVVINGKSISCLNVHRGAIQGKFCLVEAVCKLYFSQVNIQEFLFVLQNVFKVRLHTCMDDEEKAFIQYYNLPVNMLKCNKMVHLKDLEGLIPRMTYIINQRYAENQNKKDLEEQSIKQSSDKELNSANGQERGVNPRKRQSSGQGGPEKKQSCTLEQIMQRLKNQTADESSSQSQSPSVPKTTEPIKLPLPGGGVIVLDD